MTTRTGDGFVDAPDVVGAAGRDVLASRFDPAEAVNATTAALTRTAAAATTTTTVRRRGVFISPS
jgi:hypothetical protein